MMKMARMRAAQNAQLGNPNRFGSSSGLSSKLESSRSPIDTTTTKVTISALASCLPTFPCYCRSREIGAATGPEPRRGIVILSEETQRTSAPK